MQRQLEIVQEVLDREQRLQRELFGRVFGPFDAVFDLLEQSVTAIGQQADALDESARAMEQAAELMKVQADLMARTLHTLREPAELAKAAAGLERRPRKRR
jgi:ABC-type transporter Mla subunit MlaD